MSPVQSRPESRFYTYPLEMVVIELLVQFQSTVQSSPESRFYIYPLNADLAHQSMGVAGIRPEFPQN